MPSRHNMPSAENIPSTPPLAALLQRACVLEVTARKAGNVHPEAEFDDLNFEDFLRSAAASTPWLAKAAQIGVGRAILAATQATQRAVGTNTNLGISLLLAPLAAVPLDVSLEQGIGDVLTSLTSQDAHDVYTAIRHTQPGGLGEVTEGDIHSAPTGSLVEMMMLAAPRDLIAAQYATHFDLVLHEGCKILADWSSQQAEDQSPKDQPESDPFESDLQFDETATIGLHLTLISRHGDSLIARKCGEKVANVAQRHAERVLKLGWPHTIQGKAEFDRFDHWLRADGHRRNPGTTADLTAAILFATLRGR